MKGGYIIQKEAEGSAPEIVLVATGSEVALCVDAAAASGLNARIVSLPCWERFEVQSSEYKSSVLNAGCPVISVEAASTTGWERYSHYQIGMRSFGCSAPGAKCFEKFGTHFQLCT